METPPTANPVSRRQVKSHETGVQSGRLIAAALADDPDHHFAEWITGLAEGLLARSNIKDLERGETALWSIHKGILKTLRQSLKTDLYGSNTEQ